MRLDRIRRSLSPLNLRRVLSSPVSAAASPQLQPEANQQLSPGRSAKPLPVMLDRSRQKRSKRLSSTGAPCLPHKLHMPAVCSQPMLDLVRQQVRCTACTKLNCCLLTRWLHLMHGHTQTTRLLLTNVRENSRSDLTPVCCSKAEARQPKRKKPRHQPAFVTQASHIVQAQLGTSGMPGGEAINLSDFQVWQMSVSVQVRHMFRRTSQLHMHMSCMDWCRKISCGRRWDMHLAAVKPAHRDLQAALGQSMLHQSGPGVYSWAVTKHPYCSLDVGFEVRSSSEPAVQVEGDEEADLQAALAQSMLHQSGPGSHDQGASVGSSAAGISAGDLDKVLQALTREAQMRAQSSRPLGPPPKKPKPGARAQLGVQCLSP